MPQDNRELSKPFPVIAGTAHDFRLCMLGDENKPLCPELRGTSKVFTWAVRFGRAAAASVFVLKMAPSNQIARNMLPAAEQTGLNPCKCVLLPPRVIHPRTPDRCRYSSVFSGFWCPIYLCHA